MRRPALQAAAAAFRGTKAKPQSSPSYYHQRPRIETIAATRRHIAPAAAARCFTTTPQARSPNSTTSGRNRIYPPIRSPNDLQSYLQASSSSRIPLVTLWTASWCPTCKHVAPLVRSVVEDLGGSEEKQGGVAYAEVEFDSPDMSAEPQLAMEYGVRGLPVLICLDAGVPGTVVERVGDGKKLADRGFLVGWVGGMMGRGTGGGGGGGGKGGGILGGLFGGGR